MDGERIGEKYQLFLNFFEFCESRRCLAVGLILISLGEVSPSEVAEAANMLCFDTLSEDAIVNVVRYLSSNPGADNWVFLIPLDMVILLLFRGGTLSTVVRALFWELELTNVQWSFPM